MERRGVSVASDGGEEDLGPEAVIKEKSLALAPGGDHLSPSQLTDIGRLQVEFADVFSPLPGSTDLIQHHIETWWFAAGHIDYLNTRKKWFRPN